MVTKTPVKPEVGLKIDFGCGPHKKEGYLGVDIIKFDGVDKVLDVTKSPWPWKSDSVDEIHASHFLEHLDAKEREVFYNELYRVMKPGAKGLIITPHWASGRAYGDLTHKWPPVVEFGWYYLDKNWRKDNAPHSNLTCNFQTTWGYSVHPQWQLKNQETQQFGVNHYREVAQDMIATLTKVI